MSDKTRDELLEAACSRLESERAAQMFRKLAAEYSHMDIMEEDTRTATLWDNTQGGDFYVEIS